MLTPCVRKEAQKRRIGARPKQSRELARRPQAGTLASIGGGKIVTSSGEHAPTIQALDCGSAILQRLCANLTFGEIGSHGEMAGVDWVVGSYGRVY